MNLEYFTTIAVIFAAVCAPAFIVGYLAERYEDANKKCNKTITKIGSALIVSDDNHPVRVINQPKDKRNG